MEQSRLWIKDRMYVSILLFAPLTFIRLIDLVEIVLGAQGVRECCPCSGWKAWEVGEETISIPTYVSRIALQPLERCSIDTNTCYFFHIVVTNMILFESHNDFPLFSLHVHARVLKSTSEHYSTYLPPIARTFQIVERLFRVAIFAS